MSDLRELLQARVEDGSVPGAVGIVATGDDVEVAVVGSVDFAGSAPMSRDSIFRIASITKPIAAAAVMILLDAGLIALDDPISRWLPELAAPSVVRTRTSALDDVVPAARPITVFDLLTFRSGYGFPEDFSIPAVLRLFQEVHHADPRDPSTYPDPSTWLANLAAVPMVGQPGETWLYNTSSDIQGALVERVTGQSFADFLAERVFGPLGMVDTGFMVPKDKLDRLTTAYQPGPDGKLEVFEDPPGHWDTLPKFQSGAGGLVSTADDWLRFGRMLLADGGDILSAESVRLMTTDHLTAEQRAASTLFLEGQGWGFGGSVDVATIDPWNELGRYGWVGGTGTSVHVIPARDTVEVLLTQVSMTSPTPLPIMREFWQYAAPRPR
ncbi:MAG TPA: serine hydrolase domain-containing protein [Pseudonocardiaceae bacterium]|nr:serine hydrolase domain-containing protein [Pseudonocardiaceae bacterium]